MQAQEPESALAALDNQSLCSRLACTDWKNDSLYISEEQVFRLFIHARETNNEKRLGLLSDALSRRLISLAKGFAVRSHIYPINIGNLDHAAEEISQYVWECLLKRPGDIKHAQNYFGQFFKRRALDFQRTLLSKKRKQQISLDAMDHSLDEEDSDKTARMVIQLRNGGTPEEVLETRQDHAQVVSRLQAILTREEHSVYTMLYVEEMRVKDIATALNVTPRTVNNYKNNALVKIQKEFKK